MFFLSKKINSIFTLDLRSLAAFRIGLAISLLVDLMIRAIDIKAFYTDQGLLPRTLWLQEIRNPWIWSFHLMGGSVLSQTILFAIAALLACGLLIGYRTRLMTFLSWIMLTSLHNRLPSIQNSADVFMRLSLLWSLFLPLGAYASVDRLLDTSREKIPSHVYGWGPFVLLMQTALLYWTTSAYKWQGHDWRGTGSAVYYVLHLEIFATHAAHALLMFPSFLKPVTYAVMFFEALGPILLLSPFYTSRTRMLGILGLLFMHISFGLCLKVAPFSRISIMELIPFLPTEFWEWMPELPSLPPMRAFFVRCFSHLDKRPLQVTEGWASSGIIAGLLFSMGAYSVVHGFSTAKNRSGVFPPPLAAFCDAIHLDQGWNMFAPEIARTSGWFVIPGRLANGTLVDIYKDGAPVRWAPPPLVSSTFETERWRRFSAQLMGGNRTGYADYSQYLCRSWNQTHSGGERLDSLAIVLMATTALPDYNYVVARPLPMWRTSCTDAPENSHPIPLPILPAQHAHPPQLVMKTSFPK